MFQLLHHRAGSQMSQMRATSSTLRKFSTRSTTASGSVVYESDRAAHEYLQFHYGMSHLSDYLSHLLFARKGKPEEVVPYPFAPKDALNFLSRSVNDAVAHSRPYMRHRALEVGCAVGRSSFELSRTFDQVGCVVSNRYDDTVTGHRD